VPGLQCLIEIQLHHGLEEVCQLVLVDFECAGARSRFLEAKMNPHVIHVGVKSGPFRGICNPLMGSLMKQKFMQ